jgi:putative chitinase
MSAAWFWATHGLNEIADRGDVVLATKRINGGTIGLADRQAHYNEALHIFT